MVNGDVCDGHGKDILMALSFGFGFPRVAPILGGTPPPATFAVLPAAGTPTYAVTRNVLDSSGTIFIVPGTVLSSGGTSYTPI